MGAAQASAGGDDRRRLGLAPGPSRRLPRLTTEAARTPRNLEGAVYGTIVALSVTAVGSEYATDAEVFWSVVSTNVVFWLAHVYAGAVAERVEVGHGLSRRELGRLMARQWPLVQAALPLLGALLLGVLGVLSEDAAYDVALLLGVLILAGFGVLIARREGAGPVGTFFIAAGQGAFGLLVVVLKVLIH